MKKIIILAVALLFCACSFFENTEDVVFTVPREDGFDNWIICVTSGSESRKLEASSGSSVVLTMDKNSPSSVLAWPAGLSSDEKESFCYGAIFPWCRHISKKQAFSADILRDFYEHSTAAGNSDSLIKDYASRFNWEKFCLTLEKNFLEDENYNPWKLERRKILESIEAGKFSVSLLKNG